MAADSTYPSTPVSCPARRSDGRTLTRNCGIEVPGSTDERVAVDHAEPNEACVLEPRDEAEHTLLRAKRHAGLESDQVPVRRRQVVAA